MTQHPRFSPTGGAVLALTGLLALPLAAQTSRTYTTTADFAEGFQLNVNATVVPDQLQLNTLPATAPLPHVNVAITGRGTLARIDANTGAILGEYRTSPQGLTVTPNPSRTSVDSLGNVWVGNRGESGLVGGVPKGSVVKIGVCIGGTRVNADGTPNPAGLYRQGPFQYNTCVDRNGDGLIRTSSGLGDVLAWPNVTDGVGGADARVEDAVDEAILIFQRTTGVSIRHVSVAANDDAWVGGYPEVSGVFDRLDGTTGGILATFSAPGCGGHGGGIDGAGVLWSSSLAEQSVMRRDLATSASMCIPVPTNHGLGLSPDGAVWATQLLFNQVTKINPDGTIAFTVPAGGSSLDRTVCVTPADNHAWVDSSAGREISRISPTGTLLKVIDLGANGQGPTGLAVDGNGKVWTTCALSNTAKRIDPNGGGDGLGAVDLTVNLGVGADPFNYSDMTGMTALAITQPSGLWQVLYDSSVANNEYQQILWNANVPAATELRVTYRSSDDPATIGSLPWQTATSGAVLSGVFGRYVDVLVRFQRSAQTSATPVLFDLTIEGRDGNGSICEPGQRHPGSLLVFPAFDNRVGDQTLLTVTNTQAFGLSIDVEFVYIGRFGPGGQPLSCLEFNRTHRLTPNDTLTLITRAHNPNHDEGFVYAFAKSTATGAAIVHDHLIGSALVIDGIAAISHAVNPYVYQGIGPEGSATDLDGDGLRDLNGIEYSCSPDVILVPRFLGQNVRSNGRLYLINLSGGRDFDATVDFLIYNDNEEVFSAQHTFRCWDRRPLQDISGIFTNSFLLTTNHAPNEIAGAGALESGWFRMNGAVATSRAAEILDPAILALFVENIVNRETADLPFEVGGQTNGDLYPVGIFGDLTP